MTESENENDQNDLDHFDHMTNCTRKSSWTSQAAEPSGMVFTLTLP